MHANLVLFTKKGTQRTIPLSSKITVIGRRHDCDLRIPLIHISRRHCQLSKNNDDLKLRDLNSRSGTFLNGRKVNEGVVHAGDYIMIGPLTFQLQIDGKPEKTTPPAQIAQNKAQTKPVPSPQQNKPELDAFDSSAELDLSDSFAAELGQL